MSTGRLVRRGVGVVVVAVVSGWVIPVAASAWPPAPGRAHAAALFGPDFDNDGNADLAVGIPNEDVGKATNAGAVEILYGTPNGLVAGRILTQDTPNASDKAKAGDRFGAALTSGNFDDDGHVDLTIGAPGYALGAGAVFLLYGSSDLWVRFDGSDPHPGP